MRLPDVNYKTGVEQLNGGISPALAAGNAAAWSEVGVAAGKAGMDYSNSRIQIEEQQAAEAERMAAKLDQANKAQAANMAIQYDNITTLGEQEFEKNALSDPNYNGSTYVKDVLEQRKQTAEYMAKNASPEVAAYFKQEAMRHDTASYNNTFAVGEKVYGDFMGNQLEQYGAGLANQVVSDPSKFDSAYKNMEKFIDDSGVSTEMGNKFKRTGMAQLTESKFNGMLNNEQPQQVIKELDSGRYDGILDPDTKISLLKAANSAIETKKTENIGLIFHRADGVLAMAEQGVATEKDVAEASANLQIARENGTPAQANEAVTKQADINATYRLAPYFQAVNSGHIDAAEAAVRRTSTYLEGNATGKDGKPIPIDPDTYRATTKAFNAMNNQLTARNQLVDKNSAEWAAIALPEVTAKYNAMQERAKLVGAQQALIELSKFSMAAQSNAGVPESKIKPLTDSQVTALGDTLIVAAKSGNVDALNEAFDGIAQFDDIYPKVLSQLAQTGQYDPLIAAAAYSYNPWAQKAITGGMVIPDDQVQFKKNDVMPRVSGITGSYNLTPANRSAVNAGIYSMIKNEYAGETEVTDDMVNNAVKKYHMDSLFIDPKDSYAGFGSASFSLERGMPPLTAEAFNERVRGISAESLAVSEKGNMFINGHVVDPEDVMRTAKLVFDGGTKYKVSVRNSAIGAGNESTWGYAQDKSGNDYIVDMAKMPAVKKPSGIRLGAE
jgi:hypothetical protein